MLFMIIEHYRNGDPAPVYARFRERGRLAPDGLRYVNSWVTEDRATCYQIMETDDPSLIAEWTANWSDIVDFDVIPVTTSAQAADAAHASAAAEKLSSSRQVQSGIIPAADTQ